MMNNESEQLNFMSAIEAHVRWKMRLEAYIDGTSTETLDPQVICRDDQCALGKWIHGKGGQTHADHPKFQSLKEIHAKFHQSASDVVVAVDEGNPEKAREMLYKGEYSTYSHRIKAELARLALEFETY